MDASFHGTDEYKRFLEKLKREIPNIMTKALTEGIDYLHENVPKYPEPPPDSTYRRTGTLAREIATEVRDVSGTKAAVIGSPTHYAPYVIDENAQAWMHVGRWWTLQGYVKTKLSTVYEIVTRRVATEIQRVARG